MTHPMLQLPYAIWSSLGGQGLIWAGALSPLDKPNAAEYRIKVTRVLRSGVMTYELLLRYDGEQYRVAEFKGRLPKGIRESLDWRLGIEKEIRALVQKQIDGTPEPANSGL